MINTNDLKFIDDTMSNCGNSMMYVLDKKYLNKIRDFYNNEICKLNEK